MILTPENLSSQATSAFTDDNKACGISENCNVQEDLLVTSIDDVALEVIEVNGKLAPDNYIFDKKAGIEDEYLFKLAQSHESNMARLLMFLARTFAVSLTASYLFVLVVLITPDSGKISSSKDIILSLIDKQEILLAGAITGYVGVSWQNKKRKA